jgi:transcriptional regulator with XRE-family HTH domain
MLRLHLPHTVPAPHASPTACTERAPAWMTAQMVELLTASHKQIHTSGRYPLRPSRIPGPPADGAGCSARQAVRCGAVDDPRRQWADVAELLRTQRQLARLSLRHLAKMTSVSDSYLSQVERGLYEPSPEVLKSIAEALNIPINGLYERLGWLDDDREPGAVVPGVEEAIDADEQLTKAQKHALREMYRTLIGKGA